MSSPYTVGLWERRDTHILDGDGLDRLHAAVEAQLAVVLDQLIRVARVAVVGADDRVAVGEEEELCQTVRRLVLLSLRSIARSCIPTVSPGSAVTLFGVNLKPNCRWCK